MKTRVPAAVSGVGKIRPVAQNRAEYNIASSKFPAQCHYWEEQWWKGCALSVAPRLQQGQLLWHSQHPEVPHGQGCSLCCKKGCADHPVCATEGVKWSPLYRSFYLPLGLFVAECCWTASK